MSKENKLVCSPRQNFPMLGNFHQILQQFWSFRGVSTAALEITGLVLAFSPKLRWTTTYEEERVEKSEITFGLLMVSWTYSENFVKFPTSFSSFFCLLETTIPKPHLAEHSLFAHCSTKGHLKPYPQQEPIVIPWCALATICTAGDVSWKMRRNCVASTKNGLFFNYSLHFHSKSRRQAVACFSHN